MSHALLSERLTPSPIGNWVSLANHQEVIAVAILPDADVGEGLSIQMRKATDSSGTGATNFGAAATVASTVANTDIVVSASREADDLGVNGSGVQYTHVSAVVSTTGSPAVVEVPVTVLLRSSGRYAQGGGARTSASIAEGLSFSLLTNRASMANYRAVAAVGLLDDADTGEGISVQLRKSLDSAGTGETDHGSAVTASSAATNSDISAIAAARADDLGVNGSGVQYTHVWATVTVTGSPPPAEIPYGILVRADGRF